MTCAFTSLLKLYDGTTTLDVHAYATITGSIGQADTGTGSGVVEYADGSAKRWVRFEARQWTFSMSGLAPSGLWTLALAAPTWTATFQDPDNIGDIINVNVVPARPTSGTPKDINAATRPWTLVLREATAR